MPSRMACHWESLGWCFRPFTEKKIMFRCYTRSQSTCTLYGFSKISSSGNCLFNSNACYQLLTEPIRPFLLSGNRLILFWIITAATAANRVSDVFLTSNILQQHVTKQAPFYTVRCIIRRKISTDMTEQNFVVRDCYRFTSAANTNWTAQHRLQCACTVSIYSMRQEETNAS